MKKAFLIILLLFLVIGGYVAYLFLGSATSFQDNKRFLYIPSKGVTKKSILDSLEKNKIIKSTGLFNWLANRMSYWSTIKPGKYEIKKGSSLLTIVRMLRNGQQTPVNLTITKIRTREDLARLIGNRFEIDSTQLINFLTSADSLKSFGVDPEQVMTMILPDTYRLFWTSPPRKIISKLADEAKKFWTPERLSKAQHLGLTPQSVYILASIVDEETNAQKEKGNIASVYLNRIQTGMPLQADPTVKFALRDFGLKRIYQKHLAVESPYNTYRNKGLPPGPICTPSKKTIEAVLNAPKTNFIYFVASPEFDGTHLFSSTYSEHLAKAKEYQQALNRLEEERKKNQL